MFSMRLNVALGYSKRSRVFSGVCRISSMVLLIYNTKDDEN